MVMLPRLLVIVILLPAVSVIPELSAILVVVPPAVTVTLACCKLVKLVSISENVRAEPLVLRKVSDGSAIYGLFLN